MRVITPPNPLIIIIFIPPNPLIIIIIIIIIINPLIINPLITPNFVISVPPTLGVLPAVVRLLIRGGLRCFFQRGSGLGWKGVRLLIEGGATMGVLR